MTRETKVGLVISASFVCLVGIVVASKLNFGAGKSEELVASARHKDIEEPQQEPPKNHERPKEKPSKLEEVPPNPFNPMEPETSPNVKHPARLEQNKIEAPTVVVPQPVVPTPEPGFIALPMPTPPQQPRSKEEELLAEIANQKKGKRDERVAQNGFPAVPLPQPVLVLPPSPAQVPAPAPVVNGGYGGLNLPGPIPAAPDPNLIENIGRIPPDTNRKGVVGVAEMENSAGAKKRNEFVGPPAPNEEILPSLGVRTPDPVPGQQLGTQKTSPQQPGFDGNKVAPAQDPQSYPPFGDVRPETQGKRYGKVETPMPQAFPPLPGPPATNGQYPPFSNDPPPIASPSMPVIPRANDRDFQPSFGPVVPPPPGMVRPDVPDQRPLPTISSSTDISTPPIDLGPRGPSVGSRQRPGAVQTTDVAMGNTLQSDSDFRALSIRLYGSDDKAAALFELNRKHGFVSSTANINSPLVPGQQILTLRSTRMVAPQNPIMPTSVAGPGIRVGDPSPLNVSPLPTPGQNPPTADPTRSYKVSNPQGERIMDIAERLLGNRQRWTEIYRLNPTYRPEYQIPYGAELRMPAS